MNLTFIGGLSAAIVVVLFAAYLLLEYVIGPRDRAREAARLDALITPLGPSQYRFHGADESLAVDASQRRKDADAKRREAARIASGHRGPALIHRAWRA